MSGEIVNRVAKSGLINIDLSDYAPKQKVIVFEVKDFLFQEIILKEKEFRSSLKEFDFSIYNGKIVAINCSSDAIVPMWAFMLITSYLKNIASEIHFGTKEEVFQKIFTDNINAINKIEFDNKKVIVKGCGQIPLSASLYVAITKKLQNTVSSLMFGEACSAVPVYKKKK
tara:strand:+ start:878 stop:1387 length:510 start_codon:yes stop_codon:yes gene_type:complete